MREQGRSRRTNGRAALAVAASALISLLLLSACGGEEDVESTQLVGSRVSAAGVTLSLPEGWTYVDDGDRGLVLAELEADLQADVTVGPRLTVKPASTEPPDPEALVSAIAGAGDEAIRVLEEPMLVPVGAEEGVSIGLLEEEDGGAVMRRYVIVSVDGGDVYELVLEAPEDGWNGSLESLESILDSAGFEVR